MRHLPQRDTNICNRCSRKIGKHAPNFEYQQRLTPRIRAGSDNSCGDANVVENDLASIACSK